MAIKETVTYALPRACAILFVGFVSLFALDVFEESDWPIALVIHLIPSIVLTGLTVVAWKYEWWGGLLFLAAGIVLMGITNSAVIALPALVVGVLFLMTAKSKCRCS